MKNKKNLILLLTFLMCAVWGSQPARAQVYDLSKTPKVEIFEQPSDNEFKASAQKIEQKEPYGDALLSYRIYLPQDWEESSQAIGNLDPITKDRETDVDANIFSLVAKYSAPAVNFQRSYITVETQKLSHEILALNWFLAMANSKALVLAALTEVSPKEVEALYAENTGDSAYAVRVRVLINGDKVILFRYFLPQENYKTEAAIQQKVLKNIELLSPSSQSIEKWNQFGFLDQSFFEYPQSWALREKPVLTVERMSARLYQHSQKVNDNSLEGYIKVDAVSRLLKTTLAQEVKKFRADLSIPGYSLGKRIETVSCGNDKSILLQKTEMYQLVPNDEVNKQPYELMISVLQNADYHYIVSMITPARSTEYYTWSKNIQAAKIVIGSLRRYKERDVISDPYFDYLKPAQ